MRTTYYSAPGNKKTEFCRGNSTRIFPPKPSFRIGGIFYALDILRFAAYQKQRIQAYAVEHTYPNGTQSKKALLIHRESSVYTLNLQAIIYMK